MIQRIKVWLLVLVVAILAGCAGHVVRQTPDVPTRRVTSAQIVWVEPGAIPLTVSRSSYGQYSRPVIDDNTIRHSRDQVRELLAETREQMLSQIGAALKSSGATSGDDAQIRIRMTSMGHNGMGPAGILVVSVHFKDSPLGAKPWSIQVAAATSMVDDIKSVANKYAQATVAELIAAGIVKPKPQ